MKPSGIKPASSSRLPGRSRGQLVTHKVIINESTLRGQKGRRECVRELKKVGVCFYHKERDKIKGR